MYDARDVDHHRTFSAFGETFTIQWIPNIAIHTTHTWGERRQCFLILPRKKQAAHARLVSDVYIEDGITMALFKNDPQQSASKPSLRSGK
jgi:hypothetical protein